MGIEFQFGSGRPESKGRSIFGRVVMFLFATPFAAFGFFALADGVKKINKDDTGQGVGIALFGLVFAAVGLGLMYAAITAGRRKRATDEKWRAQTDSGNKPWLVRSDWAAGRIKSSTNAQILILAVMTAAFCGFGGLFTAVMLPKELHEGNYKALFILIFPLAGLGLLATFIRALLARWRYGDCYFEMASIPGIIGGTLEGMIQTGSRLHLEHALTLKISCIRRVVSDSGKDSNTHESILWQDEKNFHPSGGLPEPEPGRSGIPVYFKIPAGQPQCFSQGSETILWRLEASAKMTGPDFSTTFEVPVFHVAGAATVAMDEPDPTAALQVPAEDLRRDEKSKIQVTAGSQGKEFYFPAARNQGVALFLTVFFLIWSGVIGFMITARAPIFFPVVFGIIDVLIFWGLLQVWFKSSRVTVNSSGVTLQRRWLIFSRTCQFEAADISRFDLKVGMTSGTQAFQDIKLITRTGEESFAARKALYQQAGERPEMKFKISDPPGITLASSIASTVEARWLMREMTKALGRKP